MQGASAQRQAASNPISGAHAFIPALAGQLAASIHSYQVSKSTARRYPLRRGSEGGRMSVLSRLARPVVRKQAVKAGNKLADFVAAEGEERRKIVRRTAQILSSSTCLAINIMELVLAGDGSGMIDTLVDTLYNIDPADVADGLSPGGDFVKAVESVHRVIDAADLVIDPPKTWKDAGRAADSSTVTTRLGDGRLAASVQENVKDHVRKPRKKHKKTKCHTHQPGEEPRLAEQILREERIRRKKRKKKYKKAAKHRPIRREVYLGNVRRLARSRKKRKKAKS